MIGTDLIVCFCDDVMRRERGIWRHWCRRFTVKVPPPASFTGFSAQGGNVGVKPQVSASLSDHSSDEDDDDPEEPLDESPFNFGCAADTGSKQDKAEEKQKEKEAAELKKKAKAEAEEEERKRKQAEAELKKKAKAKAEEEEDRKRKQAEAELNKKAKAKAEEEEDRKRKQAEAELKKKAKAKAEEEEDRKRKQAEAEAAELKKKAQAAAEEEEREHAEADSKKEGKGTKRKHCTVDDSDPDKQSSVPSRKKFKPIDNFEVTKIGSFQVKLPHNFQEFDKHSSCFVCLQALKSHTDADEVHQCKTNVRRCVDLRA
jgi:hypothetical protein